MKFADYYNQYQANCDKFDADDVLCSPQTQRTIATIPTHVIVHNIITGMASVGDDDGGEELARRGELNLVPGDDWGVFGGRW